VLDIREEPLPETGGGLTLDGKPACLPKLEGEVKARFNLGLWR
jgi:hypothetical protein